MNGSVLIAHGNGDRGSRIADACSERGIRCRVVPHGAAALETALAEVPEVLVVQRDLPLIDGEKLGEILHANPRTQSVRLLFLGDRGGEAEAPEADLQVLGSSAPPEDVAESVRALLDEREKAHRPAKRPDEEPAEAWRACSPSSRSRICSSSSTSVARPASSSWNAGTDAVTARTGACSSRAATSSTPWWGRWRARRRSSG